MAKSQSPGSQQQQQSQANVVENPFDMQSTLQAISDVQFQARIRDRADIVKNSSGGGSGFSYPPDGIPVILAPIGFTVTPKVSKKDKSVLFDTYKLAFRGSVDEKHPFFSQTCVYYFDVWRAKPDAKADDNQFDRGAAGIRQILRAVVPPLEDGSDVTEDESSWLPDAEWRASKGARGDCGLLEMMCAAGRAGELFIQATPKTGSRQGKGKDGKPRDFPTHYLTYISEYIPGIGVKPAPDGDAPEVDDEDYTEPGDDEAAAPEAAPAPQVAARTRARK